jgi:hypothetical protein
MVFPLGNHDGGVKNEKDIVEYQNINTTNEINQHFQNLHPDEEYEWKHKGGTKQKRDAVVEFASGKEYGISIKNHKKGTFDLVNTTQGISDDMKQSIKEFKINNTDKPIPKKGGIRLELESILSDHLNNIPSSTITDILNSFWKKAPETPYIMINDILKTRYILFPISNFDEYCNPDHNHIFILKSIRAKTSRQIWIKKSDGTEVNTNLRIRLNLNNGITDLFKGSSVPCIKIQLDKVDPFINNAHSKIIVPY